MVEMKCNSSQFMENSFFCQIQKSFNFEVCRIAKRSLSIDFIDFPTKEIFHHSYHDIVFGIKFLNLILLHLYNQKQFDNENSKCFEQNPIFDPNWNQNIVSN